MGTFYKNWPCSPQRLLNAFYSSKVMSSATQSALVQVAQEMDLQGKHDAEKRQHRSAIDCRIIAAILFERQGYLLDAAYSRDRAGTAAEFIGDHELKAMLKDEAALLYLRTADALAEGMVLPFLTSYSGTLQMYRKGTMQDCVLEIRTDAAYALLRTAEAYEALGKQRDAREYAGLARNYFSSTRRTPKDTDLRRLLGQGLVEHRRGPGSTL